WDWAGNRLFSVKGGRSSRQDHWRSGKDQHSRRLRYFLYGHTGQHDRDRRAAAPLWTELHQSRAAAVRHAVYQRRGWSDARESISSHLPAAQRDPESSESGYRFFALYSASRNDGALSGQHVSLQRELFLLDGTRDPQRYSAQPELRRLASTSFAARVFGQPRQSGAVSRLEQAQRCGARVAHLRTFWRRRHLHHRFRTND